MSEAVQVTRELRTIPTYPPGRPEALPLFFEKRVYQGSCGKVYPLPFIDKVGDTPEPRDYQVVTLENAYVRLELLPEIGGRIFKGQDKTCGDYDFFYAQDSIKPALVGLAGPWLSGGVEFNWPQHHRPGTYMHTDVHIEEEADGARTVWMSEVDPLQRMKGMHGIRLRPGSSVVEVRVRLYNATPFTQTFLWWANVAAAVHERYQSFFPPDVTYVADHAVRAFSSFPAANNDYYGIDYAQRPGANDLRWYRNIPVPTSYMICDTRADFFGGYDHARGAGFVHVADRHIAPGKKQWTWGSDRFGQAWDRELTDRGGPYIELMAGVYTDNQPDFSYLLPYETKTFSQYFWPIQQTGPVQEATTEAALQLTVDHAGAIEAGVLVSAPQRAARVELTAGGQAMAEAVVDLVPGAPWRWQGHLPPGSDAGALSLRLCDAEGRERIAYSPATPEASRPRRALAREPELPEAMDSVEELFLTGEHLQQYRHPTRAPEPYWQEALRRDPGDTRSNLALGKTALMRGDFEVAEQHLTRAVERLTQRHPNPYTGEAHYMLGVCLRHCGRDAAAYARLYKATWDGAWVAAGHYELARIDVRAGRLDRALEHLQRSLSADAQHSRARLLMAVVLRHTGRIEAALTALDAVHALDPLDPWAHLETAFCAEAALGPALEHFRNDAQLALDCAYAYAGLGLWREALAILDAHDAAPQPQSPVPHPLQRSPMTGFTRAWLLGQLGRAQEAAVALKDAATASPGYCFPTRLEEQQVLEWVLETHPCALAWYGLGNYAYDKKRHALAIHAWEQAVALDATCMPAWRNLGIACWNRLQAPDRARAAYLRALELEPQHARLWMEYDQLRKRLGDAPEARLADLEARKPLVLSRDDTTVEYAALLNACGRSEDALNLLTGRRFHPWEGGEGKVVRQYTHARLALGRAALEKGDARGAREHFEQAMQTPENLGEAYHPLQAKAELNHCIGLARRACGDAEGARAAFELSAAEESDFSDMSVVAYSQQSYYRALSLIELGRPEAAQELFEAMLAYVEACRAVEPRHDYFATSLPNLLVFEDDLHKYQTERLNALEALARQGLEQIHAVAP